MSDFFLQNIKKKLNNKQELTTKELKRLVYDYEIDKTVYNYGGLIKFINSIINIDNELWCIPYKFDLISIEDFEHYEQPYKVKKVKVEITKTVVEYVKVEE